MTRPTVVLLGPQGLAPTLSAEVARLGLEGHAIVAVTAGWQEREHEDDELRAHLGGEVVNLNLHCRGESVFEADAELAAAYRARQDELRALQGFYRFRLDFTLAPARQLLERERGPSRWLTAERRAAIAALRALDRVHLRRVASVHRRFDAWMALSQRSALMHHRAELAELVSGAAAVVIAGGHVAVLLNRLRLFDVGSFLASKVVIAWSAGAMALGERVILFHDAPPQGAGNAEVLENGLGLVPHIVPLPHAENRLRLGDPVRVALFARRFAPSRAIPLGQSARLAWDGAAWTASAGLEELRRDGAVAPFADRGAR